MKLAAMAALATVAFSCNKMENNTPMNEVQTPETQLTTKADIAKSPMMAVYVETNDVNPLNAGDYMLADNVPLFDIVELFAANIHQQNGEPTLYLNDKLAPVLENELDETIVPLQNKNINVGLTILGDWQHIGLANMNATQQKQFANILAWAVYKYGLDGIGFDDEYADYNTPLVSDSYSNIIRYTRQLIGDYGVTGKLITVFDWENTYQITTEVAAMVDYVYHGYFGQYIPIEYCGFSGVSAGQWSPVSFNLGDYNSPSTAKSYAERTVDDGYGAMMCFNLRTKNSNQTSVLQNMAVGAGWGTVTCNGGNHSRTNNLMTSGYTITNADAKAGLAAAGMPYFNL